MSFGKGCKPSHPDKLARRGKISALPAVAPHLASPPASASLQQYEPEREDQDGVGACTAHSFSAGTATAFAAKGSPLGFLPSPKATYALTRAFERAAATPTGAQLPALTDSGAELADVVSAVAQYGIVPMGASDGGHNSDSGPDNVNEEPDLAALEAGTTHLLVGEYGVDPSDLNGAAAAIAAGFPLYVGFFCDSAFQAWTKGSAPLGAPNQNDPSGGGHAVFVDGYTTNPDGSRTWRLVNSWGTGWGDDGTCLVSDAFMQAAWEFWALDVQLAQQKGAA